MKRITQTIIASLCLTSAHATTIAYWNFNDGFDAPNGSVQIVHNASEGVGTLYQQRADTDGNGKGGVAYAATVAGKSMAWDDVGKGGDNDAEFFVQFSTTGYKDIVIRFDILGNADQGIISFDLKYDPNALVDITNPPDVTGTIKDFDGSTSTSILNNEPATTNGTTFIEVNIDLSTTTGLNDQSVVAIRLDDFKNNDAMRIDNFLITATPIPEPSSSALLGFSGIALLLRRRR